MANASLQRGLGQRQIGQTICFLKIYKIHFKTAKKQLILYRKRFKKEVWHA